MHETVNGVVKEYIYGSGAQPLTVVDASQNPIESEINFDGRSLATLSPAGLFYNFSDHFPNLRARASTASPPSAVGSEHLTGQYFDSETGLSYFGARDYSPRLTPGPRRWHCGPSRSGVTAKFRRGKRMRLRPRGSKRRGPGRAGVPRTQPCRASSGWRGAAASGPAPVNGRFHGSFRPGAAAAGTPRPAAC